MAEKPRLLKEIAIRCGNCPLSNPNSPIWTCPIDILMGNVPETGYLDEVKQTAKQLGIDYQISVNQAKNEAVLTLICPNETGNKDPLYADVTQKPLV